MSLLHFVIQHAAVDRHVARLQDVACDLVAVAARLINLILYMTRLAHDFAELDRGVIGQSSRRLLFLLLILDVDLIRADCAVEGAHVLALHGLQGGLANCRSAPGILRLGHGRLVGQALLLLSLVNVWPLHVAADHFAAVRQCSINTRVCGRLLYSVRLIRDRRHHLVQTYCLEMLAGMTDGADRAQSQRCITEISRFLDSYHIAHMLGLSERYRRE